MAIQNRSFFSPKYFILFGISFVVFESFFMFSALANAVSLSGTIELSVRDAVTGMPLASDIRITSDKAAPMMFHSDESGKAVLKLFPRKYRFEIKSNSHFPLNTSFTISSNVILPITIWLDPLHKPAFLEADTIRGSIPAGYGLFHGYIYDADDGLPIPWVQVTLENNGISTEADETGYFQMLYPVKSSSKAALPLTDMLIYSVNGYKTLKVGPFFLQSDDTLFIEDLETGSGIIQKDRSHKLLAITSGPSETQLMDENEVYTSFNPVKSGLDEDYKSSSGLVAITPPETIRLGLSCSCTSCSTVSVMSLETYVSRGLNDEWISSWSAESLRAGAVAYRSYGAYYVSHPLRSNYDICSTTCCQVNDSDTSSRTTSAGTDTAGFMLQRNGTIFRSEYSAENNSWNDPNDGLSCVNNDLSCGDGYVGSPAYSWPCLYDQVSLGHGCFGHGRGESQWGTQRWASSYGKNWNWISNHYYNASNNPSGNRSAYISTPIVMVSATPSPINLIPGETFSIYVIGSNNTETTQPYIMIGASIYNSSAGYISDPSNDRPVTLSYGQNAHYRNFKVPSWTQDGTYDLLVSYYYDSDNDDTITSTDLPITVLTMPYELTISSSSTVKTN